MVPVHAGMQAAALDANTPNAERWHARGIITVIEEFFLHPYSGSTVGWVTIAAGAAGMAALFFAVLAFAFGRALGRVGDAMVSITALLSTGVAMLLFPEHRLVEPQLALAAFSFALAGGSLAAFGGVLAITEATGWFRAQLYVATGYALLGIWLLILSLSTRETTLLPHRVVNMGIFAGSLMALGTAAIPGILAGADSEEAAPWISRYVGRAGYLGWLMLYPLWCIWLGQSRLPF